MHNKKISLLYKFKYIFSSFPTSPQHRFSASILVVFKMIIFKEKQQFVRELSSFYDVMKNILTNVYNLVLRNLHR